MYIYYFVIILVCVFYFIAFFLSLLYTIHFYYYLHKDKNKNKFNNNIINFITSLGVLSAIIFFGFENIINMSMTSFYYYVVKTYKILICGAFSLVLVYLVRVIIYYFVRKIKIHKSPIKNIANIICGIIDNINIRKRNDVLFSFDKLILFDFNFKFSVFFNILLFVLFCIFFILFFIFVPILF